MASATAQFVLRLLASLFGWSRVARWAGVVPPSRYATNRQSLRTLVQRIAQGRLPGTTWHQTAASHSHQSPGPVATLRAGTLLKVLAAGALSSWIGWDRVTHWLGVAPPQSPGQSTSRQTEPSTGATGEDDGEDSSSSDDSAHPTAGGSSNSADAAETSCDADAPLRVFDSLKPRASSELATHSSGQPEGVTATLELPAEDAWADDAPLPIPAPATPALVPELVAATAGDGAPDTLGHRLLASSATPAAWSASEVSAAHEVSAPSKPRRRHSWEQSTIPLGARRLLVSAEELGAPFIFFALTTVTLFLRPGEIFPILEEAPIYEGLICATLLSSFGRFTRNLSWHALSEQPISLCVVGLLVAIALSHLTHFYIGGVIDSGTLFAKTLVFYGLLLATVNTASRMIVFLRVVAICGVGVVAMCVTDYHGYIDFPFIEHLNDSDDVTDEGEVVLVLRMRGTGIFHDPNDISMVIVATGVLCTYFFNDRRQGWARFIWLLPLGVLAAGLLATKSRGGLLASGAAGFVLLTCWFGPRLGMVLGALGACALPILSGRSSGMGLDEEGTGSERVEIWREGFDALKSPDLVFGIGQGFYADLAGLVAHNSFIHAFVELGLFGGTLFLGAFLLAGWQLWRLGCLADATLHPELIRLRPYIGAMLAGWCGSMFSLSRCYVVPTYLILGTAAAYANIVRLYLPTGRPLVVWSPQAALRLAMAGGTTFVGLYVLTALLLR